MHFVMAWDSARRVAELERRISELEAMMPHGDAGSDGSPAGERAAAARLMQEDSDDSSADDDHPQPTARSSTIENAHEGSARGRLGNVEQPEAEPDPSSAPAVPISSGSQPERRPDAKAPTATHHSGHEDEDCSSGLERIAIADGASAATDDGAAIDAADEADQLFRAVSLEDAAESEADALFRRESAEINIQVHPPAAVVATGMEAGDLAAELFGSMSDDEGAPSTGAKPSTNPFGATVRTPNAARDSEMAEAAAAALFDDDDAHPTPHTTVMNTGRKGNSNPFAEQRPAKADNAHNPFSTTLLLQKPHATPPQPANNPFLPSPKASPSSGSPQTPGEMEAEAIRLMQEIEDL